MSLIRYPIQQYAYVVDDIEAACMRWVDLVGAGPFFLMPHHKSRDTVYRGKPCDVDVSYAFGQAGPAHIQLIQVHNDEPSCYGDMYKKGEQGFHHFAILVPDIEEEKQRFEKAGCESVTELFSSARVAYMDARHLFGCFVELYQDNPQVRASFKEWKDLHDAWDGKTDPIRVRHFTPPPK